MTTVKLYISIKLDWFPVIFGSDPPSTGAHNLPDGPVLASRILAGLIGSQHRLPDDMDQRTAWGRKVIHKWRHACFFPNPSSLSRFYVLSLIWLALYLQNPWPKPLSHLVAFFTFIIPSRLLQLSKKIVSVYEHNGVTYQNITKWYNFICSYQFFSGHWRGSLTTVVPLLWVCDHRRWGEQAGDAKPNQDRIAHLLRCLHGLRRLHLPRDPRSRGSGLSFTNHSDMRQKSSSFKYENNLPFVKRTSF